MENKMYILKYKTKRYDHMLIFKTTTSKSQLKKYIRSHRSINGRTFRMEVIFKKDVKDGIVHFIEFRDPDKMKEYDKVKRWSCNNGKTTVYYKNGEVLPEIPKNTFLLKEFNDPAFQLILECADNETAMDMLFDYEFKEEDL